MKMMIDNILVTGRLVNEIKNLVANLQLSQSFRFKEEATIQQDDFMWADAFVGFGPSPTFHLEELKWVHSLGAGVDSFLRGTEWNKNVLLTRTVCSFGQKISEYCLSYMLSDLQNHHLFEKIQTEKRWEVQPPRSLASQTVIVFGTGKIGEELAKKLTHFGCHVIGVSQSGKPNPSFNISGSIKETSKYFQQANWIINTLPLTNQTVHFFNDELLSNFNEAVFINVGRGDSVHQPSLLSAIDEGHIKRAILDVFDEEPLPSTSSLWDHPNIMMTPHISAVTSPEEGVNCFIQTLEKIGRNEMLENEVDVMKGY
jgi:phosphoglycerate dehydrogenase-like enzyme